MGFVGARRRYEKRRGVLPAAVLLDQMIRNIQMLVYSKHDVILTAIGVYSVNTKDEEVIQTKRKVEEIVFSHEHVRQMHGFYLTKDEKKIRFDIVISKMYCMI